MSDDGRRMMSLVLPFVTVLHATSTAWSMQELSTCPGDTTATDPAPVYLLNEVLVTAPRVERTLLKTPYAIDRLPRESIQRAETGLSLDEALRQVPGILIHNRHNLSQGDRIVIRGLGSRASFGVRGVKVLLDGIPLTLPDGQSQLNNLELGSVGAIEVLRGPSSSLYGNASGGVVLIETERMSPRPWSFLPRLTVGRYGLRKWQGRLSGTLGRNQYFVNTTHLQFDGFRDHAESRSTSVNIINRYHLSDDLSLSSVFNYYDAPYLFNPSSLAATDARQSPQNARFFVKSQGASKQVRQLQGGVTFKLRRSDTEDWQTTVYGQSRTLLNPIPGRIIELDRLGAGARMTYSKRLRDTGFKRLTLGLDLEVQRDQREEFENNGLEDDLIDTTDDEKVFAHIRYGELQLDQNETVLGMGPFAEVEVEISPQLGLTLGARFDRYRFEAEDHFLSDGVNDSGTRTMNQLSPMVGVTYRASPNLTLYSNISTAFQTPTTTELSNQPDREGGFNPNLDPERVRSFEVGMKGLWHNGVRVQTSVFRMNLSDILIPFQIEGSGGEEVFFRNAGEAQNNGLETSVSLVAVPNVQLSIAYTFMDFDYQEYSIETEGEAQPQTVQLQGNSLPGVPQHHLFLGLWYEHRSGLFLEWNTQWYDDYFANDFNGPPPGSENLSKSDFVNRNYTVTDFRAGFDKSLGAFNVALFVGLNNLFDQRYNGSIVPNAVGNRFFEPAPGLHWYNGVTVTFEGG